MSLSSRDRAKVNAALLEMHHAGYDTGQVTNLAATIMDMGTPPRLAYERAFNKFVERVPAFQAPLQRIGQFVEAADRPTLARYDLAMSNYISTGDRAHIEAIAPAVAHDMAALAQTTGDARFADALPENDQQPADGRGWSVSGYSPAVAASRPDAPIPTTGAPAMPGFGPTGYKPSAARADQSPGE